MDLRGVIAAILNALLLLGLYTIVVIDKSKVLIKFDDYYYYNHEKYGEDYATFVDLYRKSALDNSRFFKRTMSGKFYLKNGQVYFVDDLTKQQYGIIGRINKSLMDFYDKYNTIASGCFGNLDNSMFIYNGIISGWASEKSVNSYFSCDKRVKNNTKLFLMFDAISDKTPYPVSNLDDGSIEF